MVDEVALIEEDGEVIGFEVNGKKFYAEEEGRIEVLKDEMKDFNISSIPDGFYFSPIEKMEGEVRVVNFEGEILSDNEKFGIACMDIHIYRKYWDHKFGAVQYVKAMEKAVIARNKTNRDVEFSEIKDDGAHIFFRYSIFLLEDMPIDIAYQKFQEVVQEIEGHTERLLEGEEISKEVLNDEPKFTLELLLPFSEAWVLLM